MPCGPRSGLRGIAWPHDLAVTVPPCGPRAPHLNSRSGWQVLEPLLLLIGRVEVVGVQLWCFVFWKPRPTFPSRPPFTSSRAVEGFNLFGNDKLLYWELGQPKKPSIWSAL